MKLTPAALQQGQYILLLLLCAASAHYVYQTLHFDRVLFHRAENDLAMGQDKQARDLLRQALEHGLDRPPALIRTVEIGLESGDWSTVQHALKNFRSSGSQIKPEKLLELAGLLDRFQKPEMARDLLTAFPRTVDSSPEATLYLADLCRRTGAWTQADALYKSLAQNPTLRTRADLERAEMYAWQGQYTEAETLLRRILMNRPDLRAARITLARVLSWSGRFEEAITEYEKALGDET